MINTNALLDVVAGGVVGGLGAIGGAYLTARRAAGESAKDRESRVTEAKQDRDHQRRLAYEQRQADAKRTAYVEILATTVNSMAQADWKWRDMQFKTDPPTPEPAPRPGDPKNLALANLVLSSEALQLYKDFQKALVAFYGAASAIHLATPGQGSIDAFTKIDLCHQEASDAVDRLVIRLREELGQLHGS